MTSFTGHDETLLRTLALGVRLLSLRQAARLLGCSEQQAAATATRLREAGYVTAEPKLVSVAGDAVAPLFAWSMGDGVPNFRSTAYQLRQRWRSPSEQVILFPTEKACRLHGGAGLRPRSQGETDHDLWVASVYLRYREASHAAGRGAWVSGDTLRGRGEVANFGGLVPDACLTHGDGSTERIIEIGGKGYGAAKLARLHDCYSLQAAYELW